MCVGGRGGGGVEYTKIVCMGGGGAPKLCVLEWGEGGIRFHKKKKKNITKELFAIFGNQNIENLLFLLLYHDLLEIYDIFQRNITGIHVFFTILHIHIEFHLLHAL